MGCRQRVFQFRTWGGKRRGAGRKPRGARASERHRKRPPHDPRHPVHVTLRADPRVGYLRKRHAYRAVRWAAINALKRTDFRIIDTAIEGNHIHLIVEADSQQALVRGVQGFEISCAKHLNAALSKLVGEKQRGCVFPDRYHARALTTPRAVRNCIRYVLGNWRHHGYDRRMPGRAHDPFSNSAYAGVWRDSPEVFTLEPHMELLPVRFPKTWLRRDGWRRHGLLDPYDRPGEEDAAA